MNKLDYTIRLIGRLRTEKAPPVARYLCLLALAEANGHPMTKIEIFRRVGMDSSHGGTIEASIDKGLITKAPGEKQKYVITPDGIEIVRKLLNPDCIDLRAVAASPCPM